MGLLVGALERAVGLWRALVGWSVVEQWREYGGYKGVHVPPLKFDFV